VGDCIPPGDSLDPRDRIYEKTANMNDLPSYEDVLRMLSKKAADGSVSAMVALGRALRPEHPEPKDEVGEAIDRILARNRDEASE
jgi:hypothetical protein